MTPRVDFYLLPVDAPRARDDFACRLAEKAWLIGHRVYLHATDSAHAERLDALLWSFRPSSFVPHETAPAAASCPVVVGTGAADEAQHDVLINLGESVPAYFTRFARIAEVVLNEDAARAEGRVRWNTYRAHGCAPEHHDMQNLRGAGEH